MSDEEDLYPCVGICMSDPETGICQGCGRPPMDSPAASSPAANQPSPPAPAAGDKADQPS